MLIFGDVPESLKFSNGMFLVFYALYVLKIAREGMPRARSYDRSVSFLSAAPFALTAALLWISGMTVEWIGVHSGRLFGGYGYSDILGPVMAGVPVTLGFAWIAVVVNASLLARDFGFTGVRLAAARAVQAGWWTVLLDLTLDPVAHARGFWNWEDDGGFYGVPWSNFAGWFVVSMVLSLLVRWVPASHESARQAARLYQAMLILFGMMGLGEGLPVSAAIGGLGALLAEGSIRYAERRQGSII